MLESNIEKCVRCLGSLVVENVGDSKKKYTCTKCGFCEVRDVEGRKLLLGDHMQGSKSTVLTE